MSKLTDSLSRSGPRLMVMAPFIAAGAVASVVVAPAVTTGVVIASVLQALASLAGNMAANDLHTYFSEPLRDDLAQSKDLERAVIDAIGLVIRQASAEIIDKQERATVKQMGTVDLPLWMEVQSSISGSDVPQISSAETLQIFSASFDGFARFKILDLESWQEIVHGLAAAKSISVEGELFSTGSNVTISQSTLDLLAKRLQNTFPRALFEVLKADFAQEGKAYGELLMRLVSGISARQIQTLGVAYETLNLTARVLEGADKTVEIVERTEEKVDRVLDYLDADSTEATDGATQDYLRALSIFASNSPYLALERVLSGEKRELKDIYVPLRTRLLRVSADRPPSEELREPAFGSDPMIVRRSDEEEIGQADESKESIASEGNLANVFAVASRNSKAVHVLLQGPAGAGKSTAIRYFASHAFSEPHLLGLDRPHLPIIVRLQVLADVGGASLEERLLNSLGRAGDLVLEQTPPKGFLRTWSRHLGAPWILLLDGLDEVTNEKREDTLRWIRDLLRVLGARQVVVLTSRPATDESYRLLSSHLTVAELLPFDDIQRRYFARRWFADGGEDFLSKVDQLSTGNLFREPIVMTPLLLTVAATVYRQYGDLSAAGQVELYGKFIEILFEEAGRHGLWDELSEDVSDFAKSGLEELALSMSLDPQANTLPALIDASANFLSGELDWTPLHAEVRGKQLVEVLSKRSGVFYEQGQIFQWVHPTFREYLAAQALERRLRHSANDYQTVLGENVKNENWASVLLSLSLMHQNPEALIRWMSVMALDRFDSGAALLAHRCWQDAEESLRENLSPDIIRGLAGGLGDLQSGLATEARLREHLIAFGDDATDRIVALINDFSDLQKQLLPEWKGNRHPDVNTEAGHRIYSGFKARYHLIDVLGDIGNPAAVDPLISWLNEQDLNDSYRQDIAHHARKALKCIGIPAVGPLLNRIGDVNLVNQARTDSLHALNVVGIRTAFVAPVIEACLTEGLQGTPSLLAASLRSATRLRDREHCPAAIVALNSQEREVVAEAANYFARMPDPSAEDALHKAFAKWRSMADGSFNVNWTLKRLAAALGAVGTLKSTETVSNLIVSGLLGQGELIDADAVDLANEVRLPNFPTHLLDELVRKVDAAESGRALDRIVMQISERWRPYETSQLARAVESLQPAIDTQSLSQKLLDTYLREEAKNPTERYRRVNGEPLLRLLAKCEVTDFAEQAVRLLPGAEFWLVSQVADALWVVEHKSAERPLIQALNDFERPSMQKDRSMPEEFDIIRALGMCASERGAENVIDYINANPNLSIYVPEEVLCPLVRRRVLDVNQLAEMALDNAGTHEFVRRACVLALGYLNTEAFAPVFLKSVATESDELTKGHAAFFLGWAKSDRPKALEALKDLLTKAEKPYLAEQAAKSIVRLEDRGSLPSIEQTIERFGTAGSTSGLLRAAARFHASSTLQLLEKIHSDKPSGNYFQTEGEMIAAFGEFYHEDQAARAVVDAALENSSFGFAARTQQIAVRVLASRNPNGLLQRATTLYDEGLLDPSACGTLISHISQLTEAKDIDTKWLIEILKRCLCDQSLSIREASSASLQLADVSVRNGVYEQLDATGNEWAKACAVYSLGFWDSDERVIESARFDSSPLVRRSASIASVERAKRLDLKLISQSFQNDNGVARLSAYYSLLSNAPETALNVLSREIKESAPAGLYMRELRAGIQKRVQDERQKRIREEEDEICDRRRYVNFAN